MIVFGNTNRCRGSPKKLSIRSFQFASRTLTRDIERRACRRKDPEKAVPGSEREVDERALVTGSFDGGQAPTERDRTQAPARIVGPRVVRADERRGGAALDGHEPGAAMAALVDHRVHRGPRVASEEQRHAGRIEREEAPRLWQVALATDDQRKLTEEHAPLGLEPGG